MPKSTSTASTFDQELEEIQALVASRTTSLDSRWTELIEAIEAMAHQARLVNLYVESKYIALEEEDGFGPAASGQLLIRTDGTIGLWIPNPWHDHEGGTWIELNEVANDYKLVILQKELHRSLAQSLLESLKAENAIIKKPISNRLMTRPDLGVSEVAEGLGWLKVANRWKEAQARAMSRPDEAVTKARSLIEDVVKHILEAHKVSVSSKKKQNVTLALELLKAKTEINTKIRSSLQTLEQAVFTARNSQGDAHGSGPKDALPTPADAQLFVSIAGAVATHLMTLHREQAS